MAQRIALTTAIMFTLLATSLHAQLGVVQPAGGVTTARAAGGYYGFGGGYTYNVPQDPVMMLRLPQFIKELELVEDQNEKIKQLQEDAKELQKKAWEDYRKVAYPKNGKGTIENHRELQKEYQEARAETAKRLKERLDDILLPHQKSRLKELLIQIKLNTRGVYAMNDPMLVKELDISDKQKKDLTQKQMEAQRKLQEEIAKLRLKYQDEVFEDVFTKQQLQKLEKIKGKKYEVQRPDYSKIYNRNTQAKIKQPGAEKK